MKKNNSTISRRLFLHGAGGITLGLPLLDAFSINTAAAATSADRFALFVVGANGVAMAFSPFSLVNSNPIPSIAACLLMNTSCAWTWAGPLRTFRRFPM